jgi:predicted Zn-dependent peptidase
MLNFFKNKINKKIVNFAFAHSKILNNLLTIDKKNFKTINNYSNNNKIETKITEKNTLIYKNFTKINSKYFNSNTDSSDKDNKTTSAGTERRRLGKQKESTEETLKKKIESLKILEKQQKEIEKSKEQELVTQKNIHAQTCNTSSEAPVGKRKILIFK